MECGDARGDTRGDGVPRLIRLRVAEGTPLALCGFVMVLSLSLFVPALLRLRFLLLLEDVEEEVVIAFGSSLAFIVALFLLRLVLLLLLMLLVFTFVAVPFVLLEMVVVSVVVVVVVSVAALGVDLLEVLCSFSLSTASPLSCFSISSLPPSVIVF